MIRTGTGILMGVMDTKQDKQMVCEMVMCVQEKNKNKASRKGRRRRELSRFGGGEDFRRADKCKSPEAGVP